MNEPAFTDSNLFLRYFLNDIPEQADAVEEILKKAHSGNLTLVTNELVIAEVIWVLESFYGLEREKIRSIVLSIINTPNIQIASSDVVTQAIDSYVVKNIDFIDAFNAFWMKSKGLTVVYTFDK